MEKKLRRYDIIERMGKNDLSHWTVELPVDFFSDHLLEGGSTRGSIGEILEEIRSDNYFTDAAREAYDDLQE
jgi:hypothetical protein